MENSLNPAPSESSCAANLTTCRGGNLQKNEAEKRVERLYGQYREEISWDHYKSKEAALIDQEYIRRFPYVFASY